MRIRKKARIAACLLAASVLVTDLSGNNNFVYARQIKTADVYAAQDGEHTIQKSSVSADTGEEIVKEENDLNRQAERAFAALLQEYDLYGMLTNKAVISVLQNPVSDAAVVKELPSGYQVRFQGAVVRESDIWFQISFAVNDKEYTGFVPYSNVISQDARLENWRNQYFNGKGGRAAGVSSVTPTEGTNLSAFPSSYRSYIQKLVKNCF